MKKTKCFIGIHCFVPSQVYVKTIEEKLGIKIIIPQKLKEGMFTCLYCGKTEIIN